MCFQVCFDAVYAQWVKWGEKRWIFSIFSSFHIKYVNGKLGRKCFSFCVRCDVKTICLSLNIVSDKNFISRSMCSCRIRNYFRILNIWILWFLIGVLPYFHKNKKSSLLPMNKKIVIRIILIISNILVFMSMTQTHKIKAAIKRHRFSQYVHFPSNIILMACIKFQGYFHIK